MERFNQRCATEPELAEFRYVIRLFFGLGVLSWEDIDALLCEGKDAMLHREEKRRRPLRSGNIRSFSLSAVPFSVAVRERRTLVYVDLSPRTILPTLAGEEAAEAALPTTRQRVLQATQMP